MTKHADVLAAEAEFYAALATFDIKALEGLSATNKELRADLAASRASGYAQAREDAARLAVRRMTAWTVDDDQHPQEFRDGIERACSDLAVHLRALPAPQRGENKNT